MNPKMSLSPPQQQQFPSMNSQQRVSSSSSSSLSVPGGSSSRIKVSLKPGRSLMDWVRLGKQQGKKLNGVQGKRVEVSEEELAKHNKVDDGWLAIRGQVYNVTPYMEYHPGGAAELERGLGIDATDLFNEVHRWVNVESMLEKCHIGPLKKGDPLAAFKVPDKKKSSPSKSEPPGSYTIRWPDTVENIPWYMCKLRGRDKKVMAKHDWYQMTDQVVISIYIKCLFFTTDYVIVDLKEKTLRVTVYLDSHYFTLHLELPEEVHPNIKVTQRKGSMPMRCDLWLKKKNPNIKWTTLGLPLDDHKKKAPASDYEPCFRTCTLRKRTPVTHDTYEMTFDLPEGTQFKVPFGHHVYLKANVNGEELSRPYTPIFPSLKDSGDAETDNPPSKSSIHLMLKIYPQGQFTQHLATLKEGDQIDISNHEGHCNHECTFKQLTAVYFIAAGTGFTPMVKLIQRGLAEINKCKFNLLFFNKTQKDIAWREHLDECAAESKGKFEVTHILSAESAPSWTGLTGRISKELLSKLIHKPGPKETPVFAICGPTPFMNTAFQLLLDAGFEEKCICLFSG